MLDFSPLNEHVGVSFPTHYDDLLVISSQEPTLCHLSANDNTWLQTHHRAAVNVTDDWQQQNKCNFKGTKKFHILLIQEPPVDKSR